MKIKEKIQLGHDGLVEHGPINIVAFGDSVTHGAFGAGQIDYEAVYWNLLKKKLNQYRNYIPVNVINAGIGGINAEGSVKRIDSQVLNHDPDLVIVCFGLNDVNGPYETYISALKEIFERCSAVTDVIFMTPNMLNTSLSEDTEEKYKEYSKKTAEMQNSGRMDRYIYGAAELARGMGITVCDCYSEWKKLSETQDITKLLDNRINHPTREMHRLFADMLYNIIMEDADAVTDTVSTMYNG
ncbi:MAG: GDSL family lipase [Clostridia bacterium]|nr:GDSL family lipase [Clostridia bacterium]